MWPSLRHSPAAALQGLLSQEGARQKPYRVLRDRKPDQVRDLSWNPMEHHLHCTNASTEAGNEGQFKGVGVRFCLLEQQSCESGRTRGNGDTVTVIVAKCDLPLAFKGEYERLVRSSPALTLITNRAQGDSGLSFSSSGESPSFIGLM